MSPKIEEIVKVLRGCECCNDETFMACPTNAPSVPGCREELMCIAADLIDQLHQELIDERYRHDRYADFCVAQGEELSKLKEQQRWIPVAERLPEESGRYLTRERFGTDILSYEVLKTKGKWKTKYKNVTHWMPLPERPKEE